MSRRLLFCLSVAIAMGIHTLLFYFAPQITLLAQNAEAARAIRTIHVQLREDPGASQATRAVPVSAPTELLTRPGSVNDLLEATESELTPDFLAQPLMETAAEPASDPGAAAPAREFDLEREEAVQKRVDARILEIAQEEARRGLEVARRLVRPSSDRVLGADEFPVLRNTLGDAPPGALAFDLPSLSLLSGPIADSTAAVGHPARIEAAPMPQELGSAGNGAQSAEERIARIPVDRATAQARQESRFQFLDDMLNIELSTYTAPGEPRGYFQLRIFPRQDVQLEVLGKEVIFVIDSSNSIAPQKLRETIRGVQESLKQLRDQDTFNIVAFSDTPTLFRTAAVTATPPELEQAHQWLNSLSSRGETNIYAALESVLAQPPPQGRPRILLVLSDGRPTTGVKDGRAIINGLTSDNALRNSVFAFAGGNTVNQPLLDLLAYRNKGAARILNDIKGISAELPKFTSLLSDPILMGLDADFARIDQDAIYPRVLPDFYAGQVCTVYGRYDPASTEPFAMRLTGHAASGEKEIVFRADLGDAIPGTEEIARRWGFQKAYDIIGEMSRQGEQEPLLAELRALSRKYGFRTSYDE